VTTTETRLTDLERRGIRITLDAEGLRVRAPAGALTEELKGTIRTAKPAIMGLLRLRQAFADLTADERRRFATEVAGRNRLAEIVAGELRIEGLRRVDAEWEESA
jgi:redox-sensitive bicupin YhaK (pirin superfamily)